jgi:hypothetical protein
MGIARNTSATAGHQLNVLRSWFMRRKLRRHLPGFDQAEAALLREHGHCAACGYSRALQIHLVRPLNLTGPARALEMANVLVLCMGPNECHLRIGHGGRYSTWNPRVREDAMDALLHPSKRALIEKRAASWRTLVVRRRTLRVRPRETH